MLSICLLVSGELGFKILQEIAQSSHQLSAVFTNKNSTDIINFCNITRIPLFIGNPRKGKAKDFISRIESDLLLSVNYLFLIEDDLIDHPKKYAINIHGSLLPKYRGRTPHVWAIINGEKQAGITAHLIDEQVDNGDIVQQVIVNIDFNDTGASILKKYNDLYPKLVNKILEDVIYNKLTTQKQNISLMTYFGKRTPEDGHINWDWSKERVRNWIRAQAKPYPGAFSFYNNKKIIIHKANYSELGFHYKDENGKVLKVIDNGIFVKTPNGCLFLSNFEIEGKIKFEQGKILR